LVWEDDGFHGERIVFEGGEDADGGLAAGGEEFEEMAFGADLEEGFVVVDGGEGAFEIRVVAEDFDADGSLTGGWEHEVGWDDGVVELGGVVREWGVEETEADEAGAGEDEGVDGWVVGDLADACGDVAADVGDGEVRAEETELAGSADRAGGDDGTLGEPVETAGVFADEDVFDWGAGEDGGDAEAVGENGGDVFERVDGGVDGAGAEGFFEFLGEDAFVDDWLVAAGEVSEFEVRAEVAGGADDFADDVEGWVSGGEGGAGHFGLGESEFAAAGAEDDGFHGRES
jgi:hypothetical protein